MEKIKDILAHIYVYIFSILGRIIGKFEKEDLEDKRMSEEIREFVKKDNERIEKEMATQIDNLPLELQESLPLPNLLKLFSATHAIELLIKRNERQGQLLSDEAVYLSEEGNIHALPHLWPSIPSSTVKNEMQRFMRIDDDELASSIISWMCKAATHWKGIIPNFEVVDIDTDYRGKIVLALLAKE